MKHVRVLLVALAVVFTITLPRAQTYRALFLGNSYTDWNNLPILVENIALSNGDTLIRDQNTPGGYSLMQHSSDFWSLFQISQGNWDYVVLQDQSQRPSLQPSWVAQNVFPYAKLLADSIKYYNPCAEPVFYMTWGRKNGDSQFCGSYPPSCTYEGMQQRLLESYVQMAADNECVVAPVGFAWRNCIRADSTFELYANDGSHPNLAGSYLAACVFYNTMWRKSCVGLWWPSQIDSVDALYLQQIADAAIADSLETWRIGAQDPIADFNHTVQNNTVDFQDNSNAASTWRWDFGDGGVDSVANPQHVYAQVGDYPMTLIVTNICKADTMTDTVTVSTLLEIEAPEAMNWQVSPVPAKDRLSISYNGQLAGNTILKLTDISGKVVRRESLEFTQGEAFEMEIEALPSGLYFVSIESAQGRIVKRIAKD